MEPKNEINSVLKDCMAEVRWACEFAQRKEEEENIAPNDKAFIISLISYVEPGDKENRVNSITVKSDGGNPVGVLRKALERSPGFLGLLLAGITSYCIEDHMAEDKRPGARKLHQFFMENNDQILSYLASLLKEEKL